eukprot:3937928-Ditylum_brightwellii.AAC.1
MIYLHDNESEEEEGCGGFVNDEQEGMKQVCQNDEMIAKLMQQAEDANAATVVSSSVNHDLDHSKEYLQDQDEALARQLQEDEEAEALHIATMSEKQNDSNDEDEDIKWQDGDSHNDDVEQFTCHDEL